MMMISMINRKNSFDGSWSSWGSCEWDGVVVVGVAAAVLFVVIHSRDSLGNSTTTLLQIFSKRHQIEAVFSMILLVFSKRKTAADFLADVMMETMAAVLLPRPDSGGHLQRPPCRLPQEQRDCYSKIQLRWRKLVHELRWKSSQFSLATKALLKLITCKMGDFRQKKKMNKTFQNIASRDTWGTFAKVVINFWIWIGIFFLLSFTKKVPRSKESQTLYFWP